MRIIAVLAAACITCTAMVPAFAQGLHWPLDINDPAAQECRRQADAENSKIYFDNLLYTDRGACNSLASSFLMVLMNYRVYSQYVCQQEAKNAREEQARAREQKMLEGSRSSNLESYTSSRLPKSGGAGGSLAETQAAQQPPQAVPMGGGAGGTETTTFGSQPGYDWSAAPDPSAVPSSGGAGGSEAGSPQSQASAAPQDGGAGGCEGARGGAACRTADAPQVCDLKSLGDAQLKRMLADPDTRARLTRFLVDKPAASKARARQRTQHEKRGRASTDAESARPDSGMSPEAAAAIGTMIGIGIDAGLSHIGRRSTSGAAPRGGNGAGSPRRGTYDGPPR